MKKYCCQKFSESLEYKCKKHIDQFDCPDSLIYFSKKLGAYGLIVHDGGSSYVKIEYCPFCGSHLNKWKDKLYSFILNFNHWTNKIIYNHMINSILDKKIFIETYGWPINEYEKL